MIDSGCDLKSKARSITKRLSEQYMYIPSHRFSHEMDLDLDHTNGGTHNTAFQHILFRKYKPMACFSLFNCVIQMSIVSPILTEECIYLMG